MVNGLDHLADERPGVIRNRLPLWNEFTVYLIVALIRRPFPGSVRMRVVDVCRLIFQNCSSSLKLAAIVGCNRWEDVAEQWAKLMDQLLDGIVY